MKTRGREGIALVVVLGFLSALVLLAVAFAIIMRTERLTARYYSDQVRARQLIHAGLARCLAMLSTNVQARVYLPTNVIVSTYSRPDQSWPDFVWSEDSDGIRYVPMSLRRDASNANPRVRWVPITDPETGQLYGDYAYLIVNCSGLLDANYIGQTNRGYGLEPGEIQFCSLLPEFNADTLKDYRRVFERFETLPELYYLASSLASEITIHGLTKNALKTLPASYADNLHVFSYFPRGVARYINNAWRLDTNNPIAYIGGDPEKWNRQAVLKALEAVPGLDNPTNFFLALYDYADLDPLPAGENLLEKFARYSSEPVPMLNEVATTNYIRYAGPEGTNYVYVHGIKVIVETWYPFVNDCVKGAEFTVACDVEGYLIVQGDPPKPTPQKYNLVQEGKAFDCSKEFVVTENVYEQRYVKSKPPGSLFGVEAVVRTAAVMWGSVPVDMAINFPPHRSSSAGVLPSEEGKNVQHDKLKSFETDDPRLNWNAANIVHWDLVAEHTLGMPNGRCNPGAEPDYMYAANHAITSVAEVCYLLYTNKPWATVPLLNYPNANIEVAQLLDRLAVYDPATNPARKGLININTRHTNALACVFVDMPVGKYVKDPDEKRVQPDAARALARLIVSKTTSKPMARYSDFCEALTRKDVGGIIGTIDKFELESVVRNSMELWGTRHTMFQVFLATRVFDEAYTREPEKYAGQEARHVVGEQMAAALVWCDPYVTRDKFDTESCEAFVRMLRWLVLVMD